MNEFKAHYYDQVALIAVDVQNDFCPGGSMAVDEGDLVVPALNRVMDAMRKPIYNTYDGRDYHTKQNLVIASRDWHPELTNHFSETPNFTTTWPPHCIAGTEGAKFHPGLELKKHHDMVRVVSKAMLKDQDAYSAFEGVTEIDVPIDELLLPNKRRVALLVGGLATDYCVKATVLDARKLGIDTYVIKEAIRGVATETTQKAIEEMMNAGAEFITVEDVEAAYRKVMR